MYDAKECKVAHVVMDRVSPVTFVVRLGKLWRREHQNLLDSPCTILLLSSRMNAHVPSIGRMAPY